MSLARNPQVLRTSQQFRRVYDQGRKFHTPFYTAFFLRTDSQEQRCGITVTRKIGGAVVRNRCKRRVREVIRLFYSEAHEGQIPDFGFDLVINVKSAIIGAGFTELQEAFAKTMHRCAGTPAEPDRTVPLR